MSEQERGAAIVTGAATGFGRLTAQSLAADGWSVFAAFRDVDTRHADDRDAILGWAKQHGASIQCIEMDVTSTESVDAAVAAVQAKGPALEVVVNNAGVGGVGFLEAFTPDQMKAMFEVNVFGPQRVNRAVLPGMRERRRGILVHVSSILGRHIWPYLGAYCASKFALEALVEAYSLELAPSGIDAVLVEPGAYPTSISTNSMMPGDEARLATYGAQAEDPGKLYATLGERMAGADAPDPQEVADAVMGLVRAAPGERALRTVVGVDGAYARKINSLVEPCQTGVLNSMRSASGG